MNPYSSPSCSALPQPQTVETHRPVLWTIWIAWLYPVLVILALYGTWGLASLILGRQPIPSQDDPTGIARIVGVAYISTGVLLIFFPAVGMVASALELFVIHRLLGWRILRCVGLLCLYCATTVFLRWDPLLVLQWFMD